MAWEDGYDILGKAGGMDPLAIINAPGPQVGDVLGAAGVETTLGEATTVSPTFSGTAGAPGFAAVGRAPAPGSKYPALGFDPATGDVSEVAHLVSALTNAAQRLDQARSLVRKMQDDRDSWQGEAAEAFHRKLSEALPKYLDEGQQSLSKASRDLRGWQARLEGYQSRARGYEADAESARATFRGAWSDAVSTAADHKGILALRSRHFDSDAELQHADAEIKAALSAVEAAATRASSAYSSLQEIISEAKTLSDTHSEDATAVAKSLHTDAKDLAPHKPDFWGRIGDWFDHHGGDILSALGAVCGLIALFCPVFAIPAVLLSVGALGLHLRQDIDSGKDWGKADTWLTLAGDALGMVPGAGIVVKSASLVKDAAELGEAAAAAGKARVIWRGVNAVAEEAGGDNAVSDVVQRTFNKIMTGDSHTLTETSETAARRFQIAFNLSGATLATEGLAPRMADDKGFASINIGYGLVANGVAATDAGLLIGKTLKWGR